MNVGGRYSVSPGGRCVSSVQKQQEAVQFYVGTALLNAQNNVYKFEYDSASSMQPLKLLSSLEHPDEIVAICPVAESDEETLITTGGGCVRIVLVREDSLKTTAMLRVDGKSRYVDWIPSQSVLASTSTAVQVLRVAEGALILEEDISSDMAATARVDPRPDESRIAIADIEGIKIVDRRSAAKGPVLVVHSPYTHDVDFNPNRRNIIVSGGEQGQVMLWDMRRCNLPLSRFYGHTHWVRSVRFNPLHDDLVLSGGNDGVVHLWRSSIDEMVRCSH
mmetsp:Transcript_7827/g.23647  ORF Transcript_7827/g.23647 Transcript_7827/m.23647 type:complete len:276 (-) Transcript_7827:955-1782(-)